MTANRKRKVLIIVENLSVPFDRRVWRECMALIEAGYQVSVISPKGTICDKSKRENVRGASIYRYRIYQSRGGLVSYLLEYFTALVMSAWLAVVVYVREGFDVIQICNPPDLLVFVALPFKLLGKKIIFDQHDLSPEIYAMHKSGSDGGIVVRVLLFFERLTYLFSDIVIVVNECCRQIALERGSKPKEDVFIVRNAPAAESYNTARPDPALKNGANYLLSYVGMMGPQEGIDTLLRALHYLVVDHQRSDFHALIMGNGTVFEAMKRYAGELGIDRRITFTGHVNYDQVMQGIASADACLCPDPKTPLNDKCSHVKVAEYMSLARPIVAFDLEEVRNSAGDAALYAGSNDEKDFANKINLLLDSPDLRESMGRIGQDRFNKLLTWEHSKATLYAAYERAFASC